MKIGDIFENDISYANQNTFLKEFTYTTLDPKNLRINQPGIGEDEIADGLVYLDNILIVFQLKARDPNGTGTEYEWFERKVLGKAVDQIKKSASYLNSKSEKKIKNERGHEVYLNEMTVSTCHKVIVYRNCTLSPYDSKNSKYYKEAEETLIHIFSEDSYNAILNTLITPGAIADYLIFREKLIKKHCDNIESLSELAFLGQYMSGDVFGKPSAEYVQFVELNKLSPEIWKELVENLPDKVINSSTKDYYHVTCELAKLRLQEAKKFENLFIKFFDAEKRSANIPCQKLVFESSKITFFFVQVGNKADKKNDLKYIKRRSSKRIIVMFRADWFVLNDSLNIGCSVSWLVDFVSMEDKK